MAGAASWSFNENDFKQIQTYLQAFLRDSNARCALLVDRNGQLVATVGDTPQFDPTAFASLTAADFSANDQLANVLGGGIRVARAPQGARVSIPRGCVDARATRLALRRAGDARRRVALS